MAERIHPSAESPAVPQPEPFLAKPLPPPGTYVIQIPKDQIYRVPPPENAALFESFSRRSSRRRRSWRRILLRLLLAIVIILILLVIAVATLYLVLRPRLPVVSVSHLSLAGSSLPSFSAGFTAENPNKKLEIRFLAGGSVALSHSGSSLASGAWPEVDLPSRAIVNLNTTIAGPGVRLPKEVLGARGTVPVAVDLSAPVRFRLGDVSSWKLTVKARCDVEAASMTTAAAKITSQTCRVRLHL